MDGRHFVAEKPQAGQTLLAALRQWLPGESWSALRKLLAARRVMVNSALCLDEARRLKAGEVVQISGRTQSAPPTVSDVRLVWLDADVVVVEKPSGMITLRHWAERDWSRRKKSLQPALDDVLPELIRRREGSTKRGVPLAREGMAPISSVHRLDREASGLLVFARNEAARLNLIEQFTKHTVERLYFAVVQGELTAQTFASRLVDDRGDGRRGSTSQPGIGKRAVTHVRPLERLSSWTLTECRLETGRTHQIRIHLSEAGHPLYGDTKYGPPQSAADAPRRLALHAATLGFDHPSDSRRLRFDSPLPRDFQNILTTLRGRRCD